MRSKNSSKRFRIRLFLLHEAEIVSPELVSVTSALMACTCFCRLKSHGSLGVSVTGVYDFKMQEFSKTFFMKIKRVEGQR